MRYRLIMPPRLSGPVLESDQYTPEQLKSYNDKGYNIYYFPNDCSAPLSGNMSAKDVNRFNWVYVDMDLKDGVYKTKAEFLRTVSKFPCKPTKCIDSGHGIHAYWQVRDLDRDGYMALQKALIAKLDTDKSIWTILQLMRVPGYYNTKSNDLVMCKELDDFSARVSYNSEDLWQHLDPLSLGDRRDIDAHVNKYIYGIELKPNQLRTVVLPEKFEQMLETSEKLNEWFYNPDDRSKCDLKIANSLQMNGFTMDEAFEVISNTQKGQERGNTYVMSVVEEAYNNPLEFLDPMYDEVLEATSRDHYFDKMAKENKQYKIEQENKKVKEAKKAGHLQDNYTMHGFERELADFYIKEMLDEVGQMNNRLPFITPELGKVVPLYGVNVILIAGLSGRGKCFKGGTQVRMLDGTCKAVEDVQVGDVLIGPDSNPRTVESLHSGVDQLYDIVPVKGSKYTVNGKHELVLREKACEPIVISVEDYLKKSPGVKYKTFRSGVEYSRQEVQLDPYFLGTWLGDGHSNDLRITTADLEVVEYLESVADKVGAGLSLKVVCESGKASTYSLTSGNNGKKNPLRTIMQNYNLFNNKHIPLDFKVNNRETRLKVLAGIIDSDGYVKKDGGIDIVLKNERLYRDVLELARSLGFSAYYTKCKKTCCNNGKVGTYYRMSIYGSGIEEIPTKIPRKKLQPRRQIKNALNTGITIEKAEIGAYYGFTLKEDPLFLLEDFTVVHNSTTLANIAEPLISSGKSVACISTEEKGRSTALRTVCLQKGYNYNTRRHWLSDRQGELSEGLTKLFVDSSLKIYDSYTYGKDLKSGAKIKPLDMTTREGVQMALIDIEKSSRLPDVVMLDYITKVGTSTKNHNMEEWKVMTACCADIEEWSKRMGIPAIIFTQLEDESATRNTFKNRLPGAKRLYNLCTCIIEMKTDYENRTTQFVAHKNRDEGILFKKTVRYDKGRFVDDPSEEDTVESEE